MSRGGDATQWSAEQTLSYIKGLIAADDNDDENTLYTALSITYEYLTNATKRKITWSLSLQKLAYEFIELAFEANMHGSVKDIFKSYRAITQGQYSESLKCVLQYYRDSKLQTILQEEFTQNDLQLIRALPNIQSEQPSPEIILHSLHPEVVQREMQIRGKLKIVWEGYKSIVQTVRVNQKLQDVYMTTLNKIFDFVDRYNRVQEFKSFCRSLRTGLQNAFSKRDKAEQQKAIYIDIQKTDVNTRNIQIRMEQFKVTTKLGLWGEAFLVLEDINTLIRVRRAPLKNSLRCQFFQSLALLFSKNNFWHYHAFAYYNYYVAYLTKPKITVVEKQSLSDKLLLSILVIPAITIESQQSKQIQEKLSAMMISSTKVPERNQLVQLMVSKGVLQNASNNIRDLWNFMFLQFGVNSLKRGLELVGGLKQEYSSFKELIQASLINRQLISIAEVYQRIRIQSLERLIPLPLAQIKKMLILAHRQKTVDFTFDESQGIIVFEDQNQQVNPSQEFHNLFMGVALAYETGRHLDQAHIRRKAQDYLKNADNHIWSIRQYKIDQFKKKMKKPLLELRKQGLQREKEQREQRQREQIERKIKESQTLKRNEELQKSLATKKIIINDIISIKEQRVVRIMEKKVQNLTDQEIQNLSVEVLQQHLELTKRKINNNKEARLRKAFTNIDYLERERRNLLQPKIQAALLNEEKEKALQRQFADTAVKYDSDHKEQRARLQNFAKFYKSRVESELEIVDSQFDKDMDDYNKRLKDNFKDKILAKAKALLQENQKKKEMQFRQQDEQRSTFDSEEYQHGKWAFMKKKEVSAPVVIAKKDDIVAPIKKSYNRFEQLEGINAKDDAPFRKPQGKWGIGSKLSSEPQKKQPLIDAVNDKKQADPQKIQKTKDEKNDQKWNKGKKIEEEKIENEPVAPQKKNVFVPPPPPPGTTTEKKGKWAGQKKEEKPSQPSQPEVKKGKRF